MREVVVYLSSVCQVGSCSTWGTHLITIWSWETTRNVFCPILCCVSHFFIPDSILGFEPLIQTSLWYRYLPWLTSCATSNSSPLYVFPLAASTMQPRSSLIFVFLHPPVTSATSPAADFEFPFSWIVYDVAEIVEEVLAETQKSQQQPAGFDSLKTWTVSGKRNRKGVKHCLSNKIEQRKRF